MTSYKRFGNRWTVNECLQLQREFELLQLPIDEIVKLIRSKRGPYALSNNHFTDYLVKRGK